MNVGAHDRTGGSPRSARRRRPATVPHAVEVADLVKRYPKAPVDSLAGVSFQVRRGEVFGFLGPNGAGKTTTIGILTTRIRPTRGRALVAGVDVVADPVGARRVLGVVPQQNNLDRSLSVRQNLLFHASYHGVPRAQRRTSWPTHLLEQFGLADRPDGRPDDFSGGQIQRMMIARALMHAPAVLFLDEPSTGLDPAARLFLWEKVAELQGGGDDRGDHHPRHGRGRHPERPGGHHRPRHAAGPGHARRPGPGHDRRAHPRLHHRARGRGPTPAPSAPPSARCPG